MVPWRTFTPRKRSSLAPASFIDPAQPVKADKAPSGRLWIHEIKHDGYRLQIHKRGDRVRLYTMTGVDWTERYPWIVDGAKAIKVETAILDAEAVIADEHGVTQFDKLGERIHDASAFAYAFDLLIVNEQDMRQLPIEERKARLAELCGKRKTSGVRLSEHLEGDGPTIFEHVCRMGLEGIVSKRIGSRYKSGRCAAWIKTKNPQSAAVLRIVEGGW